MHRIHGSPAYITYMTCCVYLDLLSTKLLRLNRKGHGGIHGTGALFTHMHKNMKKLCRYVLSWAFMYLFIINYMHSMAVVYL